MTDLHGDTLAGPSTGEQRARAVAGWAGRLSLIVVVAGTVVIVATGGPTGTFWPGFLLVVAGLALALGSLVHGRIRAHERGRGFAVTALVVGLVVAVLALASHVHAPISAW
jgi:drug/metabolite transporter (DMT)-like permease